MPLNPNFEFDRVIAGANEAERKTAAEPFLLQYGRGVITFEELVAKLIGILDAVNLTKELEN